MDLFTRRYRALCRELDYTSLPVWDLYAALRPAGKLADSGLDGPTLLQFTSRHRQFVRQTLDRLGLESEKHALLARIICSTRGSRDRGPYN